MESEEHKEYKKKQKDKRSAAGDVSRELQLRCFCCFVFVVSFEFVDKLKNRFSPRVLSLFKRMRQP